MATVNIPTKLVDAVTERLSLWKTRRLQNLQEALTAGDIDQTQYDQQANFINEKTEKNIFVELVKNYLRQEKLGDLKVAAELKLSNDVNSYLDTLK